MKKLGNLNIILIAIIIALIIGITAFNYGYKLGEHKGYVLGIQKCLEDMKGNDPQAGIGDQWHTQEPQ